jgi:hypothetical protein
MPVERTYPNAKEAFQSLGIGERISALELANRTGAKIYEQRKKVSAFLSHQARRGLVKKHLGEDGRMYYEKIAHTPQSTTRRVARRKEKVGDKFSPGEIGEKIVGHIEKLKARIAHVERERDALEAKVSVFSKQKKEFKRLYHEAEERVKELSERRAGSQKTDDRPYTDETV